MINKKTFHEIQERGHTDGQEAKNDQVFVLKIISEFHEYLPLYLFDPATKIYCQSHYLIEMVSI